MNCIIVKTGVAVSRNITRKDGTKVVFREQIAAIEKGEDFPKPFRLGLADDQPPYPPGQYLLDASSFEVGDFDALKIGRRPVLIPVPAALDPKSASGTAAKAA